jgi:hypothetical protein
MQRPVSESIRDSSSETNQLVWVLQFKQHRPNEFVRTITNVIDTYFRHQSKVGSCFQGHIRFKYLMQAFCAKNASDFRPRVSIAQQDAGKEEC